MFALYVVIFLIIATLNIYNTNTIIKLVLGQNGISLDKSRGAYAAIIPAVMHVASAVVFGIVLYKYPDGKNNAFIMLLYYILLFVTNIVNNHRDKLKAFYITLFYLLVDSIIQSLGCIIVEIFTSSFNRTLATKLSSVIFSAVFAVLFKLLKKRGEQQLERSIKIIPKHIYVLLLVSLVITGELCGNFAVSSNMVRMQNTVNNFFMSLTIFIFIIIIVYLVFSCLSKQYYESVSKILEEQVTEQVEYYKKIDRLNNDLREFRHDYKNHMICVQSLLENKEDDEALEYIKGITKQELLDIHQFYTGNRIADAILSDKNSDALNIGAKIVFDGEIYDEIPAADLCTILANSIDNALEACRKNDTQEDKIIEVKCALIKNVQLIEISNPNEIDVQERNGKIQTSKEDKTSHGFGLYNIGKTIEKYNGEMTIPSKTPKFVLRLEFHI